MPIKKFINCKLRSPALSLMKLIAAVWTESTMKKKLRHGETTASQESGSPILIELTTVSTIMGKSSAILKVSLFRAAVLPSLAQL